ncbi:hypothetical protein C900_02001 [Fulvivirga imtechensis AK7]|uniref:Uncharacterized protein n=2 Tax=Fulvivirga TaxID=396811 RepID=L8JSR0_9BACT|nr:hypothetical protein C900_02001 [Fulvivirga imtechensis AK7]
MFSPVEGINFRYFLHTHSHLAFLGWVFNALFAAMIFAYLPHKAKNYRLLFWLLQLAVLGMMFTFPWQGYAAASIAFSTAHIFLSYWFAGKFLFDTKSKKLSSSPLSLMFMRWALFFMVLSSIGPFALGAIMAKGLAGTDLYQLAIYFYLHFQYDGWFTFAVFGLFFWLLERHKVAFSIKSGHRFLWLMAIACLPAYTLSTLWTHPPVGIYAVGFVAVAMQIMAVAYLFHMIRNRKRQLKQILLPWTTRLLTFAVGAFLVKITLQTASAFPAIADLAYNIRNFTIGYLHIVFLGFISVFLIGWFHQTGLFIIHSKTMRSGIVLFLSGFVLSELYIFLQPLYFMVGFGLIPYSHQVLFAISLLMPAGIGMFLFRAVRITVSGTRRHSLKIVPSFQSHQKKTFEVEKSGSQQEA